MPHRRHALPETASQAERHEDGRLFAASAERNKGPIADLLRHHGLTKGRALEIAAGTGQHAVHIAQSFPDLDLFPTDPDPERRISIDAWAKVSNLPNLHPAMPLDAFSAGWHIEHPNNAVILVVNLLHLISEAEARTLVAEAAQALAEGGTLVIYGPFLRDGETTSEGDARFHAQLQEQSPLIGYKDDFDVIEWMQEYFLTLVNVVEMPANNLAILARRG